MKKTNTQVVKNAQGQIANRNGKMFESILTPIFLSNDFQIIKYSDYKKDPEKYAGIERLILLNVPYTTIYGHKGYTEYLIKFKDRDIRLEAKSQNSAGSVDEKFPYVLMNMIEAYPEKESVLLADGAGFKQGYKNFLKKKLEENFLGYQDKGKDLHFFDIPGFIHWFNEQVA